MSVTNAVPNFVTKSAPREFTIEGGGRQPDEKRLHESEGHTVKKPRVISAATSDLEKISLVFNRKLQFVIDQASHDIIVKVIDKDTDKVIKVLPPEELQQLHNDVKEMIGFLFDERV